MLREFDMDKKEVKKNHNLILENRAKLTISGIEEVESFDENNIIMLIEDDVLVVRGVDLKINKINTEIGEVLIEGEIYSIEYGYEKQKGLFSRLFSK